ncbi:amidohydrolase family protein [Georgenia sp. TF02-10]|uniref:amidohydrolase family protein n=1 Tax=Georgenia sp. TF02-10 TaxID=2917725 RepID=UPI001FA7F7C4|nr:amidohydrolase family protein [Georgenia sp. TF02-10]UNX54299.1 amidohydrolase family protein [Georgenia sp. TF02-10]
MRRPAQVSPDLLPRRVVDAHHHLWNLETGRYPWLQGPRQDKEDTTGIGPFQHNYLPADLLADVGPVPLVSSVHVEAAWDADSATEETRWLAAVAHQHGFPQAIVAGIQLERPDAADLLEQHLAAAPVRGVRQMLDWDPRPGATVQPPRLMEDPAWLHGLSLLAPRGLSFDLQVLPQQLAQAADVAARFPETAFVLNHGGYHAQRDDETERAWRAGIARLALLPNVTVKSSGYDAVDPTWEPAAFRDYLRALVEEFGPSRVMFASNFPIDRRTIGYADLVAMCAWALDDLSEDELDAYFARNAARTYRIRGLQQ